MMIDEDRIVELEERQQKLSKICISQQAQIAELKYYIEQLVKAQKLTSGILEDTLINLKGGLKRNDI